NGTQFAGKEFKQLAQKYSVQKIWYNARYHPQCNFTERTNLTVGIAIRSYIKSHRDWDKNLSKIQQAINTAQHEVTKYSPAFLNFGRNVPANGKYYGLIKSTSQIELFPSGRDHYANELGNLTEVFEEVRQRLHQAYKRNANQYNLRKRDVEFSVGDKVWRKNKVLSDASKHFSAKLAPRYVLSIVSKKISKLIYSLRNADGTDAGEYHVKDLKPYLGSNSDVSV